VPQYRFRNRNIHYTQTGDGTPVVLLHGFCEDRRIWHDFQTDLARDYQVIAIDLPGFGQSETLENASINNYAEGVRAIIEQLNLQDLILIGHSMGGYVALAFAEKNASSLLGLGLFHSHPFADEADKKDARTKAAEFVKTHGAGTYTSQLLPKLFAPDFSKKHPEIIRQLVENAASYTNEGIVAALQAMRDRPDRSAVLQTLQCPVLFIIGEKDTAVSQEYSSAQTHLPQTAAIHILPKVGHMGMFEASEETLKIVRDFIRFCTSKVKS